MYIYIYIHIASQGTTPKATQRRYDNKNAKLCCQTLYQIMMLSCGAKFWYKKWYQKLDARFGLGGQKDRAAPRAVEHGALRYRCFFLWCVAGGMLCLSADLKASPKLF